MTVVRVRIYLPIISFELFYLLMSYNESLDSTYDKINSSFQLTAENLDALLEKVASLHDLALNSKQEKIPTENDADTQQEQEN
jgi:hypothetical protein